MMDQLPPFPTVKLLNWFARERRVFPWREASANGETRQHESSHPRDPYAVWILETMLQQTQIQTVLPYYARWMKRFPTVETLAQASEETALVYFQGLGYYRRLRLLLAGANYLLERSRWISQESLSKHVEHSEHGEHVVPGKTHPTAPAKEPIMKRGRSRDGDAQEGAAKETDSRARLAGSLFPQTRAELLKVPGIGPYTAGAILSFAFHQRAPLVDGNVIRVLSRVACLGEPKDRLARDGSAAWVLAEKILPQTGPRAARFNEAMMELGSTVCAVQRPRCLQPRSLLTVDCPLMGSCQAYLNGTVLDYPVRAKSVAVRKVYSTVLVIRREREFLLIRRPATGRLSGMWEFPTLEHHPPHGSFASLKEREQLLERKLGFSVKLGTYIDMYRAQYTRYAAEVWVYEANLRNSRTGGELPKDHVWADPKKLRAFGLSSLHARLRKRVLSDIT